MLWNHEYFDDNTEGIVKKGLNCKLKETFSILTHPSRIYVKPVTLVLMMQLGGYC